jgi:septal ring factor EnvC (AmiA/AmiB activator)
MSTITKIFVILTLILSIAYCAAAAFLFAYSHDYKLKFEDEQKAHQATTEAKDAVIAELTSKVEGYEEQITSLNTENAALKRDNDELKGTLDEKARELDDLKSAHKTLNESHLTISRTVEDLESRVMEQSDRITGLEENLDKAEERNDNLTAELTVLKDDQEKLENKLIATRKELKTSEDSRREYEDIIRRLQEAGIKIPPILVPAEPIHGQVLAVDPDTDIVVLSVGANGNVTKGMKLSIYRDDAFVGSVTVISVFPDMSSARILRGMTLREIMPGDNVTNRF